MVNIKPAHIPSLFEEHKAVWGVTLEEKKAMQEEMHLNIVNEPMEHYTNEDDIYLD